MLWLFKVNFLGFRRFLIHGNSSYVVLYTQCLRYNICSTWFLVIRISTCFCKGSTRPGYTEEFAWESTFLPYHQQHNILQKNSHGLFMVSSINVLTYWICNEILDEAYTQLSEFWLMWPQSEVDHMKLWSRRNHTEDLLEHYVVTALTKPSHYAWK